MERRRGEERGRAGESAKQRWAGHGGRGYPDGRRRANAHPRELPSKNPESSGKIAAMGRDEDARAAEKLRIAFELFEAGLALMRQNLRRRHPEESEAEIDARLSAWLRERPGAEHGDAEGRPGGWPPRRA